MVRNNAHKIDFRDPKAERAQQMRIEDAHARARSQRGQTGYRQGPGCEGPLIIGGSMST